MLLNKQLINAVRKGCKDTQEYDENIEEIVSLLKKGASVNAKDPFGNTPLHIAMYSSADLHPQIVKLLLEYGADVNAKDNHDMTPLHGVIISYANRCAAIARSYSPPLIASTIPIVRSCSEFCINVRKKHLLKSFFLPLLFGASLKDEDLAIIRERGNLQNCLIKFEQIKAMPHLGKLIEANIKKENAQAIAEYINDEAKRQELIKEFQTITEKYGSDEQLSFIPECLFSLTKKIAQDYKISEEITTDVIFGLFEIAGAGLINPLIASYLNAYSITNASLSNKQSYKVLKPLNKLMTELKEICKEPNMVLTELQLEAVPSQGQNVA